MNKSSLAYALIAAMAVIAPQAHAAGDDAGTHIYSPTPMLYQPFEMKMRMPASTMKVIEADLHRSHKISCTLSGGGRGNDMAIFHCTPG